MGSNAFLNIALIAVLVVGVIIGVLYFLNRWATKRVGNQQEMIDKNKQNATIYVIDKKKDYAKNVNLPKVVLDNLPKMYNRMKLHFVQAKLGPQIMTFMCDKKVFNVMPTKKNVKVELAGIYILGVKGAKTEEELKQIQKDKKLQEKETKASEKKKSKEKK